MFEIIPNWHPIFVHFSVALLSLSVVFFLLAWILNEHRWSDQWRHTAFWMLWTGIAASILTVTAGWFAYNSVAHDTPSHAAMTEHRNWALGTFVVYLIIGLWSVFVYQGKQKLNIVFFTVALFATGLLLSTAWRGGELVYRYGLGVISLPQSEGEGHAHSHGSDHGDGGGHAHDAMDSSMTKPHVTAEDSKAASDAHRHEPHSDEHGAHGTLDSPSGEKETGQEQKGGDHHHDDGHTHEH